MILKYALALASVSVSAQNSFFGTTVPKMASVSDAAPVTLGLPFYSSVAGTVTGGKFYKGTGNTGTHILVLFDSTGKELARATFSGESPSGWQTVKFPKPVPITAKGRYVIAYFAPRGGYADDQNYGWATLSKPPLHVTSLDSAASSGTFTYGSAVAFPASKWNRSNYWVDVLFQQGVVVTPIPGAHSVSLSWTASASPGVVGYRVYRSVPGGPFSLITPTLVIGTTYVDRNVTQGATYLYAATAVGKDGAESPRSNQAQATIPTP